MTFQSSSIPYHNEVFPWHLLILRQLPPLPRLLPFPSFPFPRRRDHRPLWTHSFSPVDPYLLKHLNVLKVSAMLFLSLRVARCSKYGTCTDRSRAEIQIRCGQALKEPSLDVNGLDFSSPRSSIMIRKHFFPSSHTQMFLQARRASPSSQWRSCVHCARLLKPFHTATRICRLSSYSRSIRTMGCFRRNCGHLNGLGRTDGRFGGQGEILDLIRGVDAWVHFYHNQPLSLVCN